MQIFILIKKENKKSSITPLKTNQKVQKEKYISQDKIAKQKA